MTARELKKKYFEYFKKREHKLIPSSPLVPENDSSVLFTTAGMHPLVPYLLGEEHPEGTRLVNVQKCLRTGDIDEVGDSSHHTFFEMLGNWSLGDYWKEESIEWSYQFIVKELGLDKNKIWVTCFAGDKDAPKDLESTEIWKKLGISEDKIFYYGKKDNWWGPAGETGPCGPDTEIFMDVTEKPCGKDCKPGDNCGRFFEIWNNVFMQYNKTKKGTFEPLKQKNVDTGMGVDRTTAVTQDLTDNYLVEGLWGKIIASIEKQAGSSYTDDKKAYRVIADHTRSAVFVIADGVLPSNKETGYVLRRLIRRAVRFGRMLGISKPFLSTVAESVIEIYKTDYPKLSDKRKEIIDVVGAEEKRFQKALEKGLNEINKIESLDGKKAFFLYESYGFPLELTEEIATERGQNINKKEFEKEFNAHKKLSRKGAEKKFKGGLGDKSEETIKFHTATHLLHWALREVLGNSVHQEGSNITAERLRFDFSHEKKLTEEERIEVEKLMNEKITEGLPVKKTIEEKEAALKSGALAFFKETYPENVSVYSIGNISRELCGGPHVKNTSEIGRVKIKKQDKIGSNMIRVYVVAEQ